MSHDDLDEAPVRVKRPAGKPKRMMPASRNFKRGPANKATVRASETHNEVQPWELNRDLLPKRPPGAKR